MSELISNYVSLKQLGESNRLKQQKPEQKPKLKQKRISNGIKKAKKKSRSSGTTNDLLSKFQAERLDSDKYKKRVGGDLSPPSFQHLRHSTPIKDHSAHSAKDKHVEIEKPKFQTSIGCVQTANSNCHHYFRQANFSDDLKNKVFDFSEEFSKAFQMQASNANQFATTPAAEPLETDKEPTIRHMQHMDFLYPQEVLYSTQKSQIPESFETFDDTYLIKNSAYYLLQRIN